MRIKTLTGLIAGLALLASSCGDDAATDSITQSTDVDSGATTDDTSDDDTSDDVASDDTSDDDTSDDDTSSGDDMTSDDMVADEDVGTIDEDAGDDMADDSVNAIISLSPTATEMIYAIGAADQVLAVDDFSNHPPEAAEKMAGLSGWEPSIEAIAGMEPDLVLTDGTNADFLDQLDTLGIVHWEGFAATSFDEVYAQIEQLGAATGNVAEAAELVAQMQIDIAAVIDGLPELPEPLTYYHELDNTYFSVTSDTFIGAVYAEMGLVNIADAVGDGNPYPQLSAEFIISENPDLLFLACTKYCGESADTVGARPGWTAIDALASGGVIEMDDDIASRWGPRIVEYLQSAGDAVAAAAAGSVTG